MSQVLTANAARLSSLDYIDMDVERLVQSPPTATPPATVEKERTNHRHHNYTNHNHRSSSSVATPVSSCDSPLQAVADGVPWSAS